VAHGSTDVGGIAHNEFVTVELDVVATHILVELHSAGQVAGIVDEDALEAHQVTYETREKDGAILTVTIRIEETLLGEEDAIAAPELVVVLVFETSLQEVQQA
jgi:hypothetical protein